MRGKNHLSKVKIIIIITLCAGILIGGYVIHGAIVRHYKKPVATNTTKYPLLAKRIQIDNPNKSVINFVPLRKQLETAIKGYKSSNENPALYFEYLPTGTYIDIGTNNDAVAASLMKLPNVMNLYRLAELGQVNLDEEISLKKEWLNSEYGTLYLKGEGYKITLRELARLTLKDSDNTGQLAIGSYVLKFMDDEKSVLSALDISYESEDSRRLIINPYSYSSILKCLYLSCFLERQDSQEILSYMSESIFNDRLTRYTPASLLFAHKIGTYTNDTQSDCGIAYPENKNYVLCIMVKGSDPEASKIISELSKMVYDYVASI